MPTTPQMSSPVNLPQPPQAEAESTIQPRSDRKWLTDLQAAIRSVPELLARLDLDSHMLPVKFDPVFPLLVPESFLRRMERGNPNDPLLLQVLPLIDEDQVVPGFGADPVGDLAARKAPGLIHKYQGRVLLMLTGQCAVHCRYCFRRNYPYETEPRSWAAWEPALNLIQQDDSIHEVILSGGDPLMYSDDKLSQLIKRLESIPHLTRIRIHSRLPIVPPSRITASFIAILANSRLSPVFVVHANHPNEINSDCSESLRMLVRSGIPTLNQAVLLKRINDSFDILRDLCEKCVDIGVIPYYLHQLDRVAGAANFEVPLEVGRRLIGELRAALPGYAVPKYVQEFEGETSKSPLLEPAHFE